MSHTNYERAENTTNEWYTPQSIIDKLGLFDLDPCAPIAPPIRIANHTFNKEQDGLSKDWSGYGSVFLNPPYSHPLIDGFIDKMVEHKNGIALLFVRTDSKTWQDKIFPNASSLLFVKGRVRFLQENGMPHKASTCANVLVSFGNTGASVLKNSGIDGFFIDLR